MQVRHTLCMGLVLSAMVGSASAHANGLEFTAPAVDVAAGLICGCGALLVAQHRRALIRLAAGIALLALVAWLLIKEPEALSVVEILLAILLAFLFVYLPFLFAFSAVQAFAPWLRRYIATWQHLRDLTRSDR